MGKGTYRLYGCIQAVFPVNGKMEMKCREWEENIYKLHYHRIYICNSIQRIFFIIILQPSHVFD